jgi:hypothetical protein|tara:strand:+ start:94495 stop:95544 length:1050 start_codon:yes stop_codon:yes gene_type:complete
MIIRHAKWKLKTLISNKDKINPKPQYQRTSVWKQYKKQLLIDSILRGYDIPKFYLRKTPNDPLYEYEVTDGQQRMRSIWEFTSEKNKFPLGESMIANVNTKGQYFEDIEELQSKIFDFEINIAIIEDATSEEIRSLFARLQLGSSLNKVELRHALPSNIGAAIWSIVENHPFFEESKISNGRYNHQDFLDHVITLSYYNAETNLKAADMERLYKELATAPISHYREILKKANKTLDIMKSINKESKGIFKRKWYFVDVFWMLYKNLHQIQSIEIQNFINSFQLFNDTRLAFNKTPEDLIKDPTSTNYDPDLYEYSMAFKYSGNFQKNIKTRNTVLEKKIFNKRNFKLKV